METRQTTREVPELGVAPPRSLARKRGGGAGGGIAVFLLLVLVVLEGVVLYQVAGRRGGRGPAPAVAAGRPPAALRAAALRLEEMGVAAEAAGAWEQFLAAGGGGSAADRALIRYRAGKLWQEAGRHGQALAAYVRAEKDLADPRAKEAVGPRIIDCLRALGRYGAVGTELRRRVGPGDAGDPSPVVAAFAGETLTRARFDRIVEKEVDEALAPYAGRMEAAALQRQREQLLRRYREPAQAEKLLKDWVVQQVMIRRARELKLDREEAFRERLRAVEGLLLAKRLRDREVTAGLKPTPSDIEGHYAAHREEYKSPEKARLRIIQVASEAAGRKLLETLKKKSAFEEAAKKTSLHEASRKDAGLVDAYLVRGEAWPGFGDSAELEEAVFAAREGAILDRPFKVGERVLLVLVEEKRPAAVRPLAEVRDRVIQDYLRAKRTELTEALIEELSQRYHVRYNLAGLEREAGAGETAGEPARKEANKAGEGKTKKTGKKQTKKDRPGR